MNAFDDTDWSRWLLGACTSGSSLRPAVVRNAEQVAVLRARIAELEAGEVRTEWGVQYGPDDVDNYYLDVEVARGGAADPAAPGVLVSREIRTGPWTPVTPENPS